MSLAYLSNYVFLLDSKLFLSYSSYCALALYKFSYLFRHPIISFFEWLSSLLNWVLSFTKIYSCFKDLWYLDCKFASISEAFLCSYSISPVWRLINSLSFWFSCWSASISATFCANYLIWISNECLSRSLFSTYLHLS